MSNKRGTQNQNFQQKSNNLPEIKQINKQQQQQQQKQQQQQQQNKQDQQLLLQPQPQKQKQPLQQQQPQTNKKSLQSYIRIKQITQNQKLNQIKQNQPIKNSNISVNEQEISRKNQFLQNQKKQTNEKLAMQSFVNISKKSSKQQINSQNVDKDQKQNDIRKNYLGENNLRQDQKFRNLYPIAIILGSPGVGKTELMKTLFENSRNELKEYQLYQSKIDDSLFYNFVDTQGFDFESNIDVREKQIKQYQSLFQNYPDQVRSLLIVVNFERTDLMKRKLLSVYKFFKKFSSIISIIITDFQLCDDETQSEAHLKQNLSFLNPRNIIFIKKGITRDSLINKLKEKSLSQIETNYKFDVKDTIFEEESELEIKEYQEYLIKRFK